jgi:hypothetical protein
MRGGVPLDNKTPYQGLPSIIGSIAAAADRLMSAWIESHGDFARKPPAAPDRVKMSFSGIKRQSRRCRQSDYVFPTTDRHLGLSLTGILASKIRQVLVAVNVAVRQPQSVLEMCFYACKLLILLVGPEGLEPPTR